MSKNNNELIIAEMQAAIEQLEFKLAFQEDSIEQLNKIVINQQYTVDKQAQLITGLVDKFKSIQASNTEQNQDNELPPHY
jgi:SlyX protein